MSNIDEIWKEAKSDPDKMLEVMNVMVEDLFEVDKNESISNFFTNYVFQDTDKYSVVSSTINVDLNKFETAEDLFEHLIENLQEPVERKTLDFIEKNISTENVIEVKDYTNPKTWMDFTNVFHKRNLPLGSAIIPYNAWQEIIKTENVYLMNYFDPVSKYEEVLKGNLGSLFGFQLKTDGFKKHPNIKEGSYLFSIPARVGFASNPIIEITNYNHENSVVSFSYSKKLTILNPNAIVKVVKGKEESFGFNIAKVA